MQTLEAEVELLRTKVKSYATTTSGEGARQMDGNRVQELIAENEQLKIEVRRSEIRQGDSKRGILGGMYEFVPDRERSILGQGASNSG